MSHHPIVDLQCQIFADSMNGEERRGGEEETCEIETLMQSCGSWQIYQCFYVVGVHALASLLRHKGFYI